MYKIIVITGATDGIGLETAKLLSRKGHKILLHGRNASKLNAAKEQVLAESNAIEPEIYQADLSKPVEVEKLAKNILDAHSQLDVLINNAGVFTTPDVTTENNLDVRFAVNTIAPYLLVKRLLPILGKNSRVVNLSSAAQAPVDIPSLSQPPQLSDGEAYAQSKLALTMWSRFMGLDRKESGPMIVSVNPGSFLGSKMVKEAYGVAGGDLSIGANILTASAVSEDFSQASGEYFDNDSGRFASPHADAMDAYKQQELISAMDEIIATFGN
ncbi:MAG: SDR family NAD(P)-dependent oxidoreductase [Acidiferrobacterales bacterium]|nr:SDR family NAD(P)-dependent oxidoreductase [Acidiferrobacterales bacterium]